MGNIIPNQNSIFKSPAVVMAFQNIHRPWRGCLWAAQSLALCLQSKRPLLCHPGSAQLASIYAKKDVKLTLSRPFQSLVGNSIAWIENQNRPSESPAYFFFFQV